jgi:hypothetical protein
MSGKWVSEHCDAVKTTTAIPYDSASQHAFCCHSTLMTIFPKCAPEAMCW